MLRRFLDVGFAPTQGGERPHVTVTMDLDALRGKLGTAMLDHGGPITAAQARMLACDAMIIPAVLGSASQVLDMGTAVRLFPPRDPPGHHPAGPRMHLPRLRPARDRGATRTTSTTGRKADPPATTTACSSAHTITA